MASQTTGKPEPIRSSQKIKQRFTSLLAAATRLKTQTVRSTGRSMKQDWQQDAWDLFDLVGEQHFLATTLANRLSQARLYVGRLTDDPTEPPEQVEDGPALEVFDAFGGSQGTRAQLIARLGLNLFVAGDGWLVGIPRHLLPDTDDITDDTGFTPVELLALSDLEWRMLSVSEVTFDTNQVTLKFGASQDEQVTVDAEDIFLIRVWRPHPRRWWEADSPTRASLPVLRELVGLTEHVSAQVDSRLAGAGVYIVPQSAVDAILARSGVPEDDEEDGDPFTEALMDAMITPIKDRSSASAYVPLVQVVPDEAADKFRHISFASELDTEARNLRDEAIRRLALGQDAPPELLLGTGDMNHWGCVDTETQIMTERGWATHDQLSAGDRILTLNHDTGVSEWQPVETVHRYEVTDAPMLRMNGIGHDSLTTMNHRWPVTSANHNRREFVTSEELNTGHLIPTAVPSGDMPSEAKYNDDFVELIGWWWTEGSYSPSIRGWGQAMIGQSHEVNPERVDRIRATLTRLFPDGWGKEYQRSQPGVGGRTVTHFQLRKHVYEAISEVSSGSAKIVSLDFIRTLTRGQLELFIDVSCQGDGWHYRDGRLDIWQRNREALAAYELALILSGRMVSTTQYGDGWVVNGWRKSTIRPIKAGIQSEEIYTGTIWCPQVENSTWLAKRNGTVWFTGNSWLVREDTVTTHVEPPLALMCDALTTQFLRPVLIQLGMSPDEADRYVIWYDVSHLIQRPNRIQDAQQAHAAGVISDDAYRDVLGFSDADAPQVTDDDPAITLAFDLVKGAPSLAQTPGIPALVDQIRAVLAGDTVAPVAPGGDDLPADDGEGTMRPPTQTINDVDLPDDNDTSLADIAAAGYQLYVDSPDLAIKARPKTAVIDGRS